MFIITQTRYAIMSLVYLLEKSSSAPITLREIAEAQNLTQSYLEQIFNRLKRVGIVKSIKGPGGGYVMSKDPSTITINYIIEIFQNTISFTACTDPNASSCKSIEKCNSHGLWVYLAGRFSAILSEITILDVYDKRYINE